MNLAQHTPTTPVALPLRERVGKVQLATGLTLVAILAVGLYLRWDHLEYADFAGDQAWSINRAYEFVRHGDFPLAGIGSSIGPSQGPVEILVLAIPVAISKDPLLATGFVGLLQMLAVVGTYFFAGRYFGRAVGLITAFLYAINPWAVLFGRKIWTPDVAPLFALLFFACVFTAVVERGRRAMTLAFLLLAVLMLTHLSGLAYLPLLPLLVLIGWRRTGWRPVLYGLTGMALLTSPYLYYEINRALANPGVLSSLGESSSAVVDLAPLEMVVMLASDKGIPELTEQLYGGGPVVGSLGNAGGAATALLALGLAICAWQVIRGLRRSDRPPTQTTESHALLLLWFAVPILASLRHTFALHPHYYIITYPIQFILIALAVTSAAASASRLGGSRQRVRSGLWAAAVLVLLAALSVPQISYSRAALANTLARGQPAPDAVPLLFAKQGIAGLRALRAEVGDVPTYLYARGQDLVWSYLAEPGTAPERVDPPDQIVLPRRLSEGVISVVGPGQESIARGLAQLGFVESSARAVKGPDGRVYFRFFHLPSVKARELVASYERPEYRLVLPNGLQLAGLSHQGSLKPGETLNLSVLWQLPQDPLTQPWGEYNLFVHLVDHTGQSLVERDWEIYQYRLLARADEYMICNYQIALPPDIGPAVTWLDVGVYERYGRQEVPWRDASGAEKEAGTANKVGSLKISPAVDVAEPGESVGGLFGDALELAGYDLLPGDLVPGAPLDVELHWRALRKVDVDYTISVQLLDDAGRLVEQHDSPPVLGRYPTSYWEPNERIVDSHRISLPDASDERRYRLAVVVYEAQTGERLHTAQGDTLSLTSLIVGPPAR